MFWAAMQVTVATVLCFNAFQERARQFEYNLSIAEPSLLLIQDRTIDVLVVVK